MTSRIVYDRFEVTLIRTTERAVLLMYEGEEAWVPKAALSMMTEDEVDRASPGDLIHAQIADWKVREMGWA